MIMKVMRTVTGLILTSCLLGGCSMALKSINLTVDPNQEFVTDKPVVINCETAPFSVKINPNSIENSGGESWVENGVINFEATEPGEYTLSVTQNDIRSNTIVLTIEQGTRQVVETAPDELTSSKRWDPKDNLSTSSKSDSEKDREELMSRAEKTVQDKKITVEEAYQDGDNLADGDQLVTINGFLPAEKIQDKAGNTVTALRDAASGEYIILTGFELPFSNCNAQISGRLTRNENGELVMKMTYASATY